MENINLDEFELFIPTPKIQRKITLPNENYLRINAQLLNELPEKIEILLHAAQPYLFIRKAQRENGFLLRKSGEIHSRELVARLVARGARIPAEYEVIPREDGWLARLKPPAAAPRVNLAHPPKRPRKLDPEKLKKEQQSL